MLSYLDSRNLASQLSSIESQLSVFQEKETNGSNNASKKYNGGYTLSYIFHVELDVDALAASDTGEVLVELRPDTGRRDGAFGGGGGGLGGGVF